MLTDKKLASNSALAEPSSILLTSSENSSAVSPKTTPVPLPPTDSKDTQLAQVKLILEDVYFAVLKSCQADDKVSFEDLQFSLAKCFANSLKSKQKRMLFSLPEPTSIATEYKN